MALVLGTGRLVKDAAATGMDFFTARAFLFHFGGSALRIRTQ
jgi:hypothetical protein